MKIGIDFHGVIDQHPVFWFNTITSWLMTGNEVHIMTGSRWKTFQKQCKEKDLSNLVAIIKHTPNLKFFSIADFHLEHNKEKVDMSNPDKPMIHDKLLWDKTKSEYASKNELDFVIDDREEYCEHFSTPYFLLKKGKIDRSKYKNLGVMNSWIKYPEEYNNCCKEKHKIEDIGDKSCWHVCTCDICKITWSYDSSD